MSFSRFYIGVTWGSIGLGFGWLIDKTREKPSDGNRRIYVSAAFILFDNLSSSFSLEILQPWLVHFRA